MVDPFETAGVASGVLSVWLTTRQSVWCWPTGLVNVCAFIVVFAKARLYADMGLQVVYVAACLYGWYAWLHGGREHGPLRVSRTPSWALFVSALGGGTFASALGLTLRAHTNAALPFLDSTLASFSLVAQWMQTRKWIESWLVWIAVDVVYVGMYVFKDLVQTAGLYAIFLVLAVMGFRAWTASLRASS